MEDIELCKRLPLPATARPACASGSPPPVRRWDERGPLRTIVLMWQLRWRYWRGRVGAGDLGRRTGEGNVETGAADGRALIRWLQGAGTAIPSGIASTCNAADGPDLGDAHAARTRFGIAQGPRDHHPGQGPGRRFAKTRLIPAGP